jgi:hypothetical protein
MNLKYFLNMVELPPKSQIITWDLFQSMRSRIQRRSDQAT